MWLARLEAPLMSEGLTRARWSMLFQLATGVAAVAALAAIWTRRYVVARIAAAAQVSLILWGWAWSQFPYLVPPDIAIGAAASPEATLRLVLIALGAGAVVLIPSLAYLLRVFKGSDRSSVVGHQ